MFCERSTEFASRILSCRSLAVWAWCSLVYLSLAADLDDRLAGMYGTWYVDKHALQGRGWLKESASIIEPCLLAMAVGPGYLPAIVVPRLSNQAPGPSGERLGPG